MTTAHQVFSNNAASTLSGTLSIGALTLNLAVGDGTNFPTPSAGEYSLITLYEKDGSGNEITYEVVKCTAITGDSMTITRDFEGLVVAAGGTSGGWAYPSAPGINPSGVVYVELRYTAYAAENNLTKDGNLEGLDSAATARTNLGLGSMSTQSASAVAITGGTMSGVTLQDSTMLFSDNSDATKKMQFELSPITTGLTRTITVRDTDITLPGTNVANTWAAIQTFTLQPILSSLTASQAVLTDASKGLVSVATTGSGDVVCGTTPTISTPVITGLPTGTGVASAATASTLVSRDASANVKANAIAPNMTSTATAAGTTTLTVASSQVQEFTGTTTQTVVLPVTSTLTTGHAFTIINNSTGLVTVQSSGANAIQIMSPGTTTTFTCILASGTTAASWSAAATSAGQMLGYAATKAIFYDAQTIAENITVGATQNALSAGPITVSGGFAVTVTAGGSWKVV